MASLTDRFDEADADVDRGEPWRFREEGAPNPLTILATSWSSGHTRLGPADFLNGVDRDGKAWSILVGSVVLTKRLVDGIIEEWDVDRQAYVEVGREGKVKPGEIVSIKYLGDREGTQYDYPDFRVARRPAEPASEPAGEERPLFGSDDDEAPFGEAAA